MQIIPIGNKTLVVNDFKAIVMIAATVYSQVFVKPESRFRKRELEFFTGCVLAFHKKISLSGKKFVDYMQTEFEYSDDARQIYNMRGILCKKKWLVRTTSGYDIPDLFKQNLGELLIGLRFKVSQQN